MSDERYMDVAGRILFRDAGEKLRDICNKRMDALYGSNPPKIILSRYEDEMKLISASDGESEYLLAKMIADKSEELGYLHGTRGYAGASFVAFLAGITEVNPLEAHHRCEKCKHIIFADSSKYVSGYDLSPMDCPVCGGKMVGDGHNIPYEMFFGCDGELKLDFDFNIAAEIKENIFDELENILGKDHIAVAGTEGRAHPAKVLISGKKKISDFTEVKYESGIWGENKPVTVLPYSELDKFLYDIDIYSISVLSKLRLLEKSTYFEAKDIAISEIDYEGFFSTDSLHGIFPEEYFKPINDFSEKKNFGELVNALGFIHSIKEDRTETSICCSDEVFLHLKRSGLSKEDAYRLTCCVGKRTAHKKGLSKRDAALMEEAGISKDYIEKLGGIRYLPPKAHLVSYALNYARSIYYKIQKY